VMALKTQHYQPLWFSNGLEGIAACLKEKPALVLLDLGLPDIDGIEALKELRLAKDDLPILIVSARDKEEEKVKALDLGADDYVTKPFGISELLARIRAALRHRSVKENQGVFSFKDLTVDFDKRMVKLRGEVLHFTPIEYKILVLLVSMQGKVLTHRYIQEEVWHYPTQDDYQSLRVFVANIRKKLGDERDDPYIVTEVGVGYRFLE
jgi:two-component system KDP operon response regulator KdpE